MLYLVAYLLHFFMPGLLVVRLLGIRKLVYLLAFSLSYSILVLNLVCLRCAGAPVDWFFRLVALETSLLFALAAANALRKRRRILAGMKMLIARRVDWAAIAALFALLAAYILYAGPYTEVPADVWSHLESVQAQSRIQETGRFAPVPWLVQIRAQQGDYWYFLHAYLCRLTGTTIRQSLAPLSAANTIVFGFGIFFTGLAVLSRQRERRGFKLFAAALSVVFGLLHTGVSVFAYARYYAFAPTMLNMITAFTAATLYWLWLDGRWSTIGAAIILPLLSLQMLLVHRQELAFAVLAALAVTLVACLRLASGVASGGSFDRAPIRRARLRPLAGLLLLAAGFITAFFLLRTFRQVSMDYAWFLLRAPSWIPLLSRGFVVNPDTLFGSVIALWGGVVYILFLLRLDMFRKNDYIIGLMTLPLLTVLNPFLVDMALRYAGSSITIMYRIGYMLPLPFVAGCLAADSVRRLADGTDRKIKHRMGAGLVLVALALPLVPLRANGNALWTTRALTLRRTPFCNDYRQWGDLLDFLDAARPGRKVITDPVTGYMLNGLTSCSSPVEKFVYSNVRLLVSEDGAELLSVLGGMDEDSDWLLVLNDRDGAPSETGKASGHWPEDVLQVSASWPPGLKKYVNAHPEYFRKIWEGDRISVYNIGVRSLNEALPSTPKLLSAAPVLLEGPGMRLDWTAVNPRDFVAYHIQHSDDGAEWRDLCTTREYCYPWIHHQGRESDVCGNWSWCLPPGSTYHYRVRAIYRSGPGQWSNVETAAVPDYAGE